MNGRPKHHTRQRTVVSLKLKSDAVTLGRNLSVAPRVTQSARLSPHRGWRTVPSPCHPPPHPLAHSLHPLPTGLLAVPAPGPLHMRSHSLVSARPAQLCPSGQMSHSHRGLP